MPYSLELNDSTSMIGRGVSPTNFADMIIDEFDELLLAADEQPLIMSIVLHTFISGVPFRLRQITRALEHITQHGSDVWFARPRDIFAVIGSSVPATHTDKLGEGASVRSSVATGDHR